MPNQLEHVMYLVFRADLKMPVGKIAAQAGHAVQGILDKIEADSLDGRLDGPLKAYQELQDRMNAWYPSSTKVALRASDLVGFTALRVLLTAAGVRHYVVVDEGRTCVEPNTPTCLAIEPLRRCDAAQFVKDLKLLR